MQTVLRSKNVLINEEFIEADIVIQGSIIKSIDTYKSRRQKNCTWNC